MPELNNIVPTRIHSSEELINPKDEQAFIAWLGKKYGFQYSLYSNYYKYASKALKDNLESSEYWKHFEDFLREINLEYQKEFSCELLETTQLPEIYIKELKSVVNKAFRKNFLKNDLRPEEPKDGWIGPDNWFEKLNDILRTTIVVNYLDGVSFLITKLKDYANKYGYEFKHDYEARDNGYYAAHTGTKISLTMPRNGDLEDVNVSISLEIQITTPLQKLVKDLLHTYYEEDRCSSNLDEPTLWQWEYKSDRFNTNYMGHIVHYVEGMIVRLRDKRNNNINNVQQL